MIYDEEFLKALDLYPHHNTWAKVIALDNNEYPIEEITGKITSGSINVDGSSAVRRTCSLTLAAEDVNINDYYWGLKTKVELSVGLENHIDPNYPDIIWFKQGIFVISSFNCSVNVNQYTISIQGKDKMSFLNGDVGGIIPATWDFGKIDTTVIDENGQTQLDSTGYAIIEQQDIPIKQIILEAVHEFAQEPFHKIIINDLDDFGIELLQYQGTTPLYFQVPIDAQGVHSREIEQIWIEDKECFVRLDTWRNGFRIPSTQWFHTKFSEIEKVPVAGTASDSSAKYYQYEQFIDELDFNKTVSDSVNYMRAICCFAPEPQHSDYQMWINAWNEGEGDSETWGLWLSQNMDTFTLVQITRNNGLQTCGYRICDIIYPYDLIASPGETITSVLDKLVKMLGNFEYFFDVDGNFIFQKKKTYTDVSYNNIMNEHSFTPEIWAESTMYTSKYSYSFDNSTLISSIQNSPNINNIKNDYSLWGQRPSSSGSTVPIHMRFAIDHKPWYYKSLNRTRKSPTDSSVIETVQELFFSEEGISKYNSMLDKDNQLDPSKSDLIKVVDWRELIFQMAQDYRKHYHDDDFLVNVKNNSLLPDGEFLYPFGITGYEKYYIDFEMNISQGVIAYWRELYNPTTIGRGGSLRYLSTNLDAVDEKSEFDEDVADWVSGQAYSRGDRVWRVTTYKDEDDNVQKERRIYRSLKNNNTDDFLTDEGYFNNAITTWTLSPGNFTYNSDGWNSDIIHSPETLNFWFDFLDRQDSEINRYSVHNIGLRSKAVNDDKLKSIYFREIPNVIFETDSDVQKRINKNLDIEYIKTGYRYFYLSNQLMDLFTISSRGKSCLDSIDEYLYNYTYANASISLNSVPIYHLTPNTIIYVNDPTTGIVGEYIMSKFSIQLGLQSSMSISANETIRRIY